MILPTKHIRPESTLLAGGGEILAHLSTPATVSTLWERVQPHPALQVFERFVLTLDLLFIMGAVDFERGLLVRRTR